MPPRRDGIAGLPSLSSPCSRRASPCGLAYRRRTGSILALAGDRAALTRSLSPAFLIECAGAAGDLERRAELPLHERDRGRAVGPSGGDPERTPRASRQGHCRDDPARSQRALVGLEVPDQGL